MVTSSSPAELDCVSCDLAADDVPEVDHEEILDRHELGHRWRRVDDRDGHRTFASLRPVVERVFHLRERASRSRDVS